MSNKEPIIGPIISFVLALVCAGIWAIFLDYIYPCITLYQSQINSIVYVIIIIVLFIVFWFVLANKFKIHMRYSLLAIGLFIIAVLYITFSSGLVPVPDLMGKSHDESAFLLEKEGLLAEYSYKEVNDSSFVNKVISQDPQSNLLVKKGTKINIIIGKNRTEQPAIDNPSDGATVTQQCNVNGTVGDLSPGQNLYVLVQPQSKNGDGPFEWWVQSNVIVIGRNWECNAELGTTSDSGRQFRIVAIITKDKLNVGKYQFSLPQYDQIDSVTVTRQ